MLMNDDDSLVVLIDFQPRLLTALTDGDSALRNATVLAKLARLFEVPLWATEQSPEKLGATHADLAAQLEPSRILAKTGFSACANGLAARLRPPQRPVVVGNARSLPKHLQKPVAPEPRNSVILAGCEAHVCLLQTALDLVQDEFDVWVVTDACASRTERNRDAAFDRLAAAGVELVTTEMVAFEWLRDASHPAFREVQKLVKTTG